ncbi:hypothetical protein FA13DRAFT_1727394 [Coprinellus micaceus]|uniref:Uncharacterized protein n=1 Tax=Coprinellus micaceus TaxID=71717 RepID=A0A4Y7TPF4_COPMI|nr:hypothetical protein FA13DRAFT_1727394 [Coprinellus micaceus]
MDPCPGEPHHPHGAPPHPGCRIDRNAYGRADKNLTSEYDAPFVLLLADRS